MTPMPEPDVMRVCLDCEFATAEQAKADAHWSLTGHAIAIDFVPHDISDVWEDPDA